MKHHASSDAVEFLGLRFARSSYKTACDWIIERSRKGEFSYLITPNVDHVVRLHREPPEPDRRALWQAYGGADLTLCDSRILSLLARWSGIDLPVVTGSSLTARLLSAPLPEGMRIAIIGGNDAQRRWLAAAYPKIVLSHHRPPMGLRTNQTALTKAAEFVEEAQPHVTLLTVGSPQSELLAHLIKCRGQCRGVALCVGASLEFITGEKRRAPRFIQNLYMEWAFRLIIEPKRLWRRYLIQCPAIWKIWRSAR